MPKKSKKSKNPKITNSNELTIENVQCSKNMRSSKFSGWCSCGMMIGLCDINENQFYCPGCHKLKDLLSLKENRPSMVKKTAMDEPEPEELEEVDDIDLEKVKVDI